LPNRASPEAARAGGKKAPPGKALKAGGPKGFVETPPVAAAFSDEWLLADSVFFLLVRAVNLTALPFYEAVGKPYGMSLHGWRVMMVLARLGQTQAKQVAQFAAMDKMTVSRAIAGLTKAGRVSAQPHGEDKRARWLSLTPKGWQLYRSVAPASKLREQELLAVLSSAERLALQGLLERLVSNPRLLED
jgi:DNA-binding MarR family transcriptional regulator